MPTATNGGIGAIIADTMARLQNVQNNQKSPGSQGKSRSANGIGDIISDTNQRLSEVHGNDRPSAAQTKREYMSADDKEDNQSAASRLKKQQEEAGYTDDKQVGRVGSVMGGGDNFQDLFDIYSDQNLGGQTLDDFLLNSTADQMYDFVNAPFIRDWYQVYGDLSDRGTFDNWFNENEQNNNLDDLDGIYSSPERVTRLYGTDADVINTLNSALVGAGVTMADAQGNPVTAAALGLDEGDYDEDTMNAMADAANLHMMNQGVLGSALYSDLSPYLSLDDINQLANETIEYGTTSDYDQNTLMNPEGVRETVGNIPTFDKLWIYDPEVYQASVEGGWNNDGLGSAYRGLANLLATRGGVGYKEREA